MPRARRAGALLQRTSTGTFFYAFYQGCALVSDYLGSNGFRCKYITEIARSVEYTYTGCVELNSLHYFVAWQREGFLFNLKALIFADALSGLR